MANSSSKKGHYGDDSSLNALHLSEETDPDSGACLTGHSFNYYKGGGTPEEKACCYRWQNLLQANAEDRHKDLLHNYPTDHTELIKTSCWMKNDHLSTWWYATRIYPPGPGDWHIGGPNQDRKVYARYSSGADVFCPAGKNFFKGSWPYWNNSHHLLPKGTLMRVILGAFDDSSGSNLIQKCLLEAKYNVNHKINMVFLPMDKEVARLLGTLRHLQLKEGDSPTASECYSHSEYEKMVIDGLNPIIASYKKIVDKALQKAGAHDLPKAKLDKTKLEKLSKHLFNWIYDNSDTSIKTYGGKSIDYVAKKTKKSRRRSL